MTDRKPISRAVVIQLIKTHGVMCQVCKNQEFEHIHHIDEDPSNNAFTNLMLLCHMSWTKTYQNRSRVEAGTNITKYRS